MGFIQFNASRERAVKNLFVLSLIRPVFDQETNSEFD